MQQKNLQPVDRARLDAHLTELERKIAQDPSQLRPIVSLITLLESYQPKRDGFGAYTDCQNQIFQQIPEADLRQMHATPGALENALNRCVSLLAEYNINPPCNIYQTFHGRNHYINGVVADCGLRKSLFGQKSVISVDCMDCYKVQILPLTFASLMQLYLLLKYIELPRDNLRKCMIEVREAVQSPYKGYIYCESEDEANACADLFGKALEQAEIKDIGFVLTHGCSEFSLAFPKFKYAADGSHREFERPSDWDQIETAHKTTHKGQQFVRPSFHTPGISIRDLLCFRAWYQYARTIGDDTCEAFAFLDSGLELERLVTRVKPQAQARQAELAALRERFSAAA